MSATWFLALLAVYLLSMLAIGLFDRRRAATGREAYFLADRSLSPFRTFVGLASTTTGGSTTLVLCAAIAANGLAGFWYDLAGALGLVWLGVFLAAKVRRTGAVTLPEIAGRMYGEPVRRTAAVLVILAEIVWFALLTQATQAVLQAALGIGPLPALLLSAGVFIGYTTLGGQYSVIRTDLVQYALMWGALIFVAAPICVSRAGGLAVLLALPQASQFPFAPSLGATKAAAILLTIGLPHLVGSDVFGKLLSARTEGAARFAAVGAGIAKLLFGAGIAAIALAAFPLGTAGGAATLPKTLLAALPPLLVAPVLVALVATMQSSCDSVLLTAVATTVNDALPERFEKTDTVRAARWLAILYGALGLLVALRLQNLLETLKLGYTLFASSLILPVLAGFLPELRRPTPAWTRLAMLAGAAAALVAYALDVAEPVLPGLAANAIGLGIGAVATASTRELPDAVPDPLAIPDVKGDLE